MKELLEKPNNRFKRYVATYYQMAAKTNQITMRLNAQWKTIQVNPDGTALVHLKQDHSTDTLHCPLGRRKFGYCALQNLPLIRGFTILAVVFSLRSQHIDDVRQSQSNDRLERQEVRWKHRLLVWRSRHRNHCLTKTV